ncbi:carbon-nitrogen hydrolase family protein [Sulfurisphaera ohwakuensis]|uniref:Carbon-nitrogen hydrolase family protein n=1 Tax=Sulfurisphaera ohwakuensis TaxID=69656 RepID=A0A650CJS3_SULOH|nr:carbon-nitrogen hydrolase family protein [Sulfurisphaera ohwakuensis]MBB5253868.1 putative amidohydrolase [Sulfurisphaera ohwakuensis]QGR17935.1 carbon-nitrogen hydrolase family protein [Sulfurisphaera ohwakuensis]
MKIGIVQPLNTSNALYLTEESLKSGAEIVLLPEKWIKTLDDLPLHNFQQLAKKYTAYIIPGAVEDGVSIISPLIDPNGEIKAIAKKIHLFGDEKNRLLSGSSAIIFKYRGIKIGIAICYDVDFPEIIREMFLKGVEILLVPSKIPKDGIDLWREYLKVRVLENRIALVNANTFSPPEYLGMSIAYVPSPRGRFIEAKPIGELGDKEGQIVIDINPLSYMSFRIERLKEYKHFEIKELE